jgi:hypothetical protein
MTAVLVGVNIELISARTVRMRMLVGATLVWMESAGIAFAQGLPVDTGSQIPVMLWFIGAGILGLVIAYGIMRNRGRTRAEKQLTESATKNLYRREENDR